MPLSEIASYDLPYTGTKLVVARGSVLDFQGEAIVNAANSGCLGGGGVDGAISRAGGPNLAHDRRRLPVVGVDEMGPIRCKVGSAVLTGPNDYGSLIPAYVIHAVGPDFWEYQNNIDAGIRLLHRAYCESLSIAYEAGVEAVGFSLLSAGVFRGPLKLHEVFSVSIQGIKDWNYKIKKLHDDQGIRSLSLKEIHLCAFTPQECYALKEICDHEFRLPRPQGTN